MTDGTTPADTLGLQAALIADLRRIAEMYKGPEAGDLATLAADRIEALTVERQERDRAAVNRVAEMRARLARAEECIEQVRAVNRDPLGMWSDVQKALGEYQEATK